jgi:predicted alpha/beta hydrolase
METLKLRIVEINTTAYTEEDFLLLTDLSDEQIKSIIVPIVGMERDDDIEYCNDELVDELKNVYPNNFIEMYTKETIDYISI